MMITAGNKTYRCRFNPTSESLSLYGSDYTVVRGPINYIKRTDKSEVKKRNYSLLIDVSTVPDLEELDLNWRNSMVYIFEYTGKIYRGVVSSASINITPKQYIEASIEFEEYDSAYSFPVYGGFIYSSAFSPIFIQTASIAGSSTSQRIAPDYVRFDGITSATNIRIYPPGKTKLVSATIYYRADLSSDIEVYIHNGADKYMFDAAGSTSGNEATISVQAAGDNIVLSIPTGNFIEIIGVRMDIIPADASFSVPDVFPNPLVSVYDYYTNTYVKATTTGSAPPLADGGIQLTTGNSVSYNLDIPLFEEFQVSTGVVRCVYEYDTIGSVTAVFKSGSNTIATYTISGSGSGTVDMPVGSGSVTFSATNAQLKRFRMYPSSGSPLRTYHKYVPLGIPAKIHIEDWDLYTLSAAFDTTLTVESAKELVLYTGQNICSVVTPNTITTAGAYPLRGYYALGTTYETVKTIIAGVHYTKEQMYNVYATVYGTGTLNIMVAGSTLTESISNASSDYVYYLGTVYLSLDSYDISAKGSGINLASIYLVPASAVSFSLQPVIGTTEFANIYVDKTTYFIDTTVPSAMPRAESARTGVNYFIALPVGFNIYKLVVGDSGNPASAHIPVMTLSMVSNV